MSRHGELTKNKLAEVARLYEELPNSRIIDKAIGDSIAKFRSNDVKGNVYIKVVLINGLYKTAIIDTPTLANHIFKKGKEIDKKLELGDISVIDDIRQGHGIRSQKRERNFYSFATKYAHFHNPKDFPICDNRIIRLLTQVNRQRCFYSERFSQIYLRDYRTYKCVIDSLAKHLGIAKWSYKKIDQGLWLWARYLDNPELLSARLKKKLRSIIGQ